MPRSAMLRSVPVVASIVAALLLAVGPAAAKDVSRTIYVPEGWEGAYEFGYAPVLRVGETVIVSGVPAGGDGTYEEKIRGMYTRVRELLETAGATIDDVVELTTFHAEPKDSAAFRAEFERYMPIHREFFGEHRPAWTAVGTTALLSRTAPVEMRVVAVVGSGRASRVVRGEPETKPSEAGKPEEGGSPP
ncbi:MAG TPA: Rid family hydrolase [Thermoanaerobaculia bacterium]